MVPSFDPIGLLSVVYKDSTGQSIDVTPGVNLTTDRKLSVLRRVAKLG